MRSGLYLLLVASVLSGCVGGPEAKRLFNAGEYNASAGGLSSLADQGDPVAQMDLGYLYQHGFGVTKDRDKAIALYQQAADKGLTRAVTCLGLLLIEGRTTGTDFYHGVELLRQADAAGDMYASYDLAYLYDTGWGVAKDPAEAARLKKRASADIEAIYSRYRRLMWNAVAANQHYPATAANRYGGKVTVEFTIDAPFARDAKVAQSSGHLDLDNAAVAAVYQTYYPGLPPGIMNPNYFQVVINFGSP